MVSITATPPTSQEQKTLFGNPKPRRERPNPAEPPPEPYRPSAFIIGVHSADPAASIVSHLPDSLALVDEIENFALIRSTLRAGRRAMGSESVPLVSNSKSHPTLPPWKYVPTEPSWCYQVFRKDVYVCRHFPATPPPENPPSVRAAIYEFSDKSRANLDHICCNSGHLIKSQFCLTYHDQNPTDGIEVKRHLDRWLKALRRRLPCVGYLWVLEFQKRGVPHYHVWLTAPPDAALQRKMARSWVKITKGTEEQYKRHCLPSNWCPWDMQNGVYAKKYAIKQVQKDVPPEFQNVGRFWGSSRSLQPVATLFGPGEIANLTKKDATPWEPAAVRHYFDKILRRYQEKQMNYNKKGTRRRDPKTGKVLPWRKASMTRSCSELSGNFKIANGAKVVEQLLSYVVTNPPDRWSIQAATKEKIPF